MFMSYVRSRRAGYACALLGAAVLSLIPSVLWQDFVTPYPYWAVWERSADRLTFQGASASHAVPLHLNSEAAVFKVLVAPSVVPSLLGAWRPEYTRLAFPDGVVTEAVAMLAPSALAMQFFRTAFWCWSVLLVAIGELSGFVVRRMGQGRRAASAGA